MREAALETQKLKLHFYTKSFPTESYARSFLDGISELMHLMHLMQRSSP